ncbi:MAG: PilZ domain-containing protein, partial [Candidatus Rokubacteria bacterium]|nr:PilZ domain-containing protein [Candidatus Rokubacteria bacterium]
LIQSAAEALYQAKARGKNRISVYFREKRDYIRFDTRRRQLRVQVLHPEFDEAVDRVLRTKNISRSGMLFESETPYTLGQRLELACSNLNGQDRLVLHARVVRVEEQEGAGGQPVYEIGVVFIFQWEHEETQLADFLKHEKIDSSKSAPQKTFS